MCILVHKNVVNALIFNTFETNGSAVQVVLPHALKPQWWSLGALCIQLCDKVVGAAHTNETREDQRPGKQVAGYSCKWLDHVEQPESNDLGQSHKLYSMVPYGRWRAPATSQEIVNVSGFPSIWRASSTNCLFRTLPPQCQLWSDLASPHRVQLGWTNCLTYCCEK